MVELRLKCGHLTNQDTFGCLKGARNREVLHIHVYVGSWDPQECPVCGRCSLMSYDVIHT